MTLLGPSPGQRLGPYELDQRLGNGGMAEVYIARRAGPHGFKKRFAIKRILPQLAVDSRFVDMFCDEARICAALCHPNIVQVVDFGECDGELFMAMEYVEGVSLARLLRAVAARGERFPLGAMLYIATEVLRGLRFAHEARDEQERPLHIVHRDVSPGNILIGRAGEVKLTDFGIVLSAFVDRRTYPGELKGKMGYMSPEQVIGEELDARSDLFTLGIVLAEMLVTRPLFPGKNELEMLTRMYEADTRVLERHSAELPLDLVRAVRSALTRDREKRVQTARDFEESLRNVARELGIVLSDSQLVPWLNSLGVLPSQSGVRDLGPAAKPAPRVGRLLESRLGAAAPGASLGAEPTPTHDPKAEEPRPVAPDAPVGPRRTSSSQSLPAAPPRTSSSQSLPVTPPRTSSSQSLPVAPPRPDRPRAAASSASRKLSGEIAAPAPPAPLPARSLTPPQAFPASTNLPYDLWVGGQRRMGPITVAKLLELAATGRLNPTMEVSQGGGANLPISTIPSVAALLERPAFQFWGELAPSAWWQRTIDRRSLPGALFSIARRRDTGLLVLQDGQRQKRIFYEAGLPRFVSSTEAGELLGASLVAAGLLEAADVERSLILAGGRAQRLGETLVAVGLLRPTALLRALIEQLESRFLEVGTWSQGRLLFVRDLLSEDDKAYSHSTAIDLVGRALREGYSDEEIAGLLSSFQELPIARLPAEVDPGSLGLSAPERRALELAPGASSLRKLTTQLARDAASRPEDTLRGVFVGLCAGLLVMPGWPPTLLG